MDQGLELNNVSDEMLEKGIIKEHMLVYYVEKDNKMLGSILFSYLGEYGYVFAITW